MSLHELVIDAAAAYPDRLAVSGPDGDLTYAELNHHADALAARLAARGVRPGDRVVIWAEKSAAFVAAMQAVLRLGAAYVPVDGNMSAARTTTMIRDIGARAVCVDASNAARLPADTVSITVGEHAMPHSGTMNHQTTDADLAYVLYTSGSTGAPKGVQITHGNARAFVDWWVGELAAETTDRFSNHAPFTFDLSVLDLYCAFSVGASVHLLPTHLAYAPGYMVDFLHQHEISIWYSVPSALSLMMREGGLLDRPAPSSLRAVLFAGEPFPIGGVRRLARWTAVRLLNLYGPTETNVCTFHEVTPATLERDRPAPIGTPTCGDTVWAMTDDGVLAGPGEEGELWVAGPTVTPGYWGSPPVEGPYHTGDIVRVLPDGSFDFVGRRDGRVKVRGYRIELGDVEAALTTHPDVAEAVAVVVGEGLDGRLEAFVVSRDTAAPGVLALKRHCAERLPSYMVPDTVHRVPVLPRARTGKVDRSALVAEAARTTKEKIS